MNDMNDNESFTELQGQSDVMMQSKRGMKYFKQVI